MMNYNFELYTQLFFENDIESPRHFDVQIYTMNLFLSFFYLSLSHVAKRSTSVQNTYAPNIHEHQSKTGCMTRML